MDEKIRFKKNSSSDFFYVLKKRVETLFEEQNLSPHANGKIHFKVITLCVLYLLCYFSLISNYFGFLSVCVLYSCIGLIKALIGFNLTHDALHGAYSSNPKINRILGYSFDLNGTSSLIWKISHNVLHHTYTNIPGVDQDIEKAILLRLSPQDKLYPFHKWQHIYAPFLYAMIGFNWVFYADYAWFWKEARQRKVPSTEIFLFVLFKMINMTLFLLFPLLYLSIPWWQVLIAYSCMHVVGGITIALVFQLAHIVDNVQFPLPNPEGEMENTWAIHEMYTTSNFGTQSSWTTNLVGGLNFQIEHHLFPKICHVHYPMISNIVKQTASEFQIPYFEQPSFLLAVRSHFRTLKLLGLGKIK